jgi:phosphonate transport system permease protein
MTFELSHLLPARPSAARRGRHERLVCENDAESRISRPFAYSVLPQVFARFIGFCTYQLDSNLRNSTMVGIVGAGGIGMILDSALNLFQWNRVATILLAIFVVVILAEIVVTFVRRRIL